MDAGMTTTGIDGVNFKETEITFGEMEVTL